LHWIEHVATARRRSGGHGGLSRRRRVDGRGLRRHCATGSRCSGVRLPRSSLCVSLRTRAGRALGASELLLELLIAVLQLLDQSGQAADFLFEPIDPQHEIGGGELRHSHRQRPIRSRAFRCAGGRSACGRDNARPKRGRAQDIGSVAHRRRPSCQD
jgi:hypothetical protein